MATAFAQAFDSGLIALYDAMGERCDYRDKDGWTTICTVIPDRDLTQYGDAASVQGATAVLSVRRSEVPHRPRRNDTFELTETCEIFKVDSVLTSDDFEHQVIVI